MTKHVYDRIEAGKSVPGVFEVSQNVLIADAIEDLLLIATCSIEGEYEGQIRYLPLR